MNRLIEAILNHCESGGLSTRTDKTTLSRDPKKLTGIFAICSAEDGKYGWHAMILDWAGAVVVTEKDIKQ